jgi:hypothetical protein
MIFLGCEDTITLGLIKYVLLKIMKLVYLFFANSSNKIKILFLEKKIKTLTHVTLNSTQEKT